jgi:hypothetical protein
MTIMVMLTTLGFEILGVVKMAIMMIVTTWFLGTLC